MSSNKINNSDKTSKKLSTIKHGKKLNTDQTKKLIGGECDPKYQCCKVPPEPKPVELRDR